MITPPPETSISLSDFEAHATNNGCLVATPGGEKFIGDPPSATNYPHVHVWRDDTIALSIASGVNQKIGKDDVILIAELQFAFSRYGARMPNGPLKETIKWVLASAS